MVEALRHLNGVLRPLAVKLDAEERKSGVGKLLKGEAAELLKVARYAMANPALVKGFAAKDGGIDPKVFEGDALPRSWLRRALLVHRCGASALPGQVEQHARGRPGVGRHRAPHRRLPIAGERREGPRAVRPVRW